MHSTVVIKRNVAPQNSKQLAVLAECVAVNHVRFHGMEEGFHEGVISYLARAVHALGNS